jgi:hypothetical protein
MAGVALAVGILLLALGLYLETSAVKASKLISLAVLVEILVAGFFMLAKYVSVALRAEADLEALRIAKESHVFITNFKTEADVKIEGATQRGEIEKDMEIIRQVFKQSVASSKPGRFSYVPDSERA